MRSLFPVAWALCLLPSIQSSSILFLLPYAGKSHYLNIRPIIETMADRGHNVTVITPFVEPPTNYRQVIGAFRNLWNSNNKIAYDTETWSMRNMLNFVWDSVDAITKTVLETPAVMDFIVNDTTHYDLIFVEFRNHESMYMFAHKYNAPMVGMSTFGSAHHILNIMGNPIQLAYMAHEYLDHEVNMAFPQRLNNLASTVYEMYWRTRYHLPKQQRLAEKHFGHLPGPLPRLEDLENNISVAFLNTHFSYDLARPYVPGVIEVGGVHIAKPKPLSDNLKTFLDRAVDGAIFFSLGTNIQSEDMTQEKIDIFLDVFRQLKQRVLWKWEGGNFSNHPNNLMTGKWMPQNDILAHPNVKIFITHGGLLSTQESMYNGVPVIVLPFFGDQRMNARRIANDGFGLTLSFKNLDRGSLKAAIDTLLNDAKYQRVANDIASRFKDRPTVAMDTVVYWMEYVIRHKGAPFMKSPAVGMSGFVYYAFDIAVFLLVFILFMLLLGYFLIYYILMKCRQISLVKKNLKSD